MMLDGDGHHTDDARDGTSSLAKGRHYSVSAPILVAYFRYPEQKTSFPQRKPCGDSRPTDHTHEIRKLVRGLHLTLAKEPERYHRNRRLPVIEHMLFTPCSGNQTELRFRVTAALSSSAVRKKIARGTPRIRVLAALNSADEFSRAIRDSKNTYKLSAK